MKKTKNYFLIFLMGGVMAQIEAFDYLETINSVDFKVTQNPITTELNQLLAPFNRQDEKDVLFYFESKEKFYYIKSFDDDLTTLGTGPLTKEFQIDNSSLSACLEQVQKDWVIDDFAPNHFSTWAEMIKYFQSKRYPLSEKRKRLTNYYKVEMLEDNLMKLLSNESERDPVYYGYNPASQKCFYSRYSLGIDERYKKSFFKELDKAYTLLFDLTTNPTVSK